MSMNAEESLKEVSKALFQCGLDGSDKRLQVFLTKFGITTHNPDGSWRSTGEVLAEIAEVYKMIQND